MLRRCWDGSVVTGGIENKEHRVRDETLGEDRYRLRTESAPQVLAGIEIWQ